MNEDISNAIYNGLTSIANAITPLNAMAGSDATGGHIASLTEAVIGITNALVQVADAINNVSVSIDFLNAKNEI